MSEAEFQEASNKVRGGSYPNLTDDQQLQLYGLFKQANVGNVDTERPGIFSLDFTGQRKWDAWKSNEGLSKEEARKKYIALVNSF